MVPLIALVVLAAVPIGGCKPAPAGQAAPAGSTIGAPFQLVDQDGKPANQGVLTGRWTALFFGYTYCPDACPTTLTKLGAATQQLGPKGDNLQVVLISIDPERDTPAKLKAYLSSPVFPKKMTALTGTPAQIAAVAKNYGVYYSKNGAGADYLMDHSTAIYLFDPKGHFVQLVRPDIPPDELAATLSEAMAKG
ncbi:MAG: SCO family protein [Caulobacteraceae bacterium]